MSKIETAWRPVKPSDAISFEKCQLAGFTEHPYANDYTLCGVVKYPSDEQAVYYVVRHDGSTTFFKESDLVVKDER